MHKKAFFYLVYHLYTTYCNIYAHQFLYLRRETQSRTSRFKFGRLALEARAVLPKFR